MDRNIRVALFDLEASNLNGSLGILLCGVVKDCRGKIERFRIDDDPAFRSHIWDDRIVCMKVRDALEARDIIVGWNSGGSGPYSFDVPFLQTRLLMNGLRPLRMPKHVDLMRTAKFQLKFHSNSLASVSESLMTDRKTKLDGRVWIKATCGHKPSLDSVVNHCVMDVVVLEKTLEKLGPHVKIIKDYL